MFAQTSALSSSLLGCQQRTALRSRQAQQVHAIHCGTSQSNTVIQTQETTCKQVPSQRGHRGINGSYRTQLYGIVEVWLLFRRPSAHVERQGSLQIAMAATLRNPGDQTLSRSQRIVHGLVRQGPQAPGTVVEQYQYVLSVLLQEFDSSSSHSHLRMLSTRRAAQIRAGTEVLVQLSGQTTVAQAHMLE